MTILLDSQPASDLAESATLPDAIQWANSHLKDTGKVIIKVELDGVALEGPALADPTPLQNRRLNISTADQKELAHAMIGKLAALVEYLGTRHHSIAALLEQGQAPKALEQLAGVLSAWQQIQQGYTNLHKMINIDLDALPVGELSAFEVAEDFCRQLREIENALHNQDMVLLADILQYEMDAAITNWTNLLAATLGVVDGVITLK